MSPRKLAASGISSGLIKNTPDEPIDKERPPKSETFAPK